ncbi:hypothetical protein [Arthrobacter rhombi]|uniref:hypothetical protein n=1 Tax=Arthrobacter rhombi TaxID=71253 RepID=UPI003FD4A6CB
MYAHTVRRVPPAVPRLGILLTLLAVLMCMAGVAHAHDVSTPPAHGSVSSQNIHETPLPPAGDSVHCSAGIASDGGCLTVSSGHLLAAPPPPFIGWLADAPRPAQPSLRPTAHHPPSPTPGELSINRT